MCEICSKVTIKTLGLCFAVLIVIFEQTLHIVLCLHSQIRISNSGNKWVLIDLFFCWFSTSSFFFLFVCLFDKNKFWNDRVDFPTQFTSKEKVDEIVLNYFLRFYQFDNSFSDFLTIQYLLYGETFLPETFYLSSVRLSLIHRINSELQNCIHGVLCFVLFLGFFLFVCLFVCFVFWRGGVFSGWQCGNKSKEVSKIPY